MIANMILDVVVLVIVALGLLFIFGDGSGTSKQKHSIPWMPYHQRPSGTFKEYRRKRALRRTVRASRQANRGVYRG